MSNYKEPKTASEAYLYAFYAAQDKLNYYTKNSKLEILFWMSLTLRALGCVFVIAAIFFSMTNTESIPSVEVLGLCFENGKLKFLGFGFDSPAKVGILCGMVAAIIIGSDKVFSISANRKRYIVTILEIEKAIDRTKVEWVKLNGMYFTEEPSAEEKPEESSAEEKPEEPSAEEKPEESSAEEKPEEPSAVEKPEEPSAVEKPEEPSAEEKPEESSAEEKPEEPSVEEQIDLNCTHEKSIQLLIDLLEEVNTIILNESKEWASDLDEAMKHLNSFAENKKSDSSKN